MTEQPKEKKDKGEHIRGSELRVTERDILGSLPLVTRFRVWVFGGAYGMRDPDSKLSRIVLVYLPPIWKRIYYKRFYRWFHKQQKPSGEVKDE